MMDKILIVGNFGYSSNKFNGQTIRTQSVYEILKKMQKIYKFTVSYIDTSNNDNKNTRIRNYIDSICKYFSSHVVIVLPAQRAVKFMLPVLFYMNYLLNKDVHFVAIGGWIADFIEDNKKYIKYVQSFRGIYVQTNSLKQRLEKDGLNNVFYFPNFRVYKDDYVNLCQVETVKEIVFYSRVTEEKGIKIAIDAIGQVNKNCGKSIKLSIYGPVEEAYKNRFEQLMIGQENVSYKGILMPNRVLQTLSTYDLLVFPTHYEGEGFPGTILDSMSAGLPIVASNWKYNSEILIDGYTGILFESKNTEDLIEKITMLINNVELINKMKKNCILESEKYKDSNVILTLINNIF